MTRVYQNHNLFIAMYIFTYKECVMAGGATIDNDFSNYQQTTQCDN